MGRAQVAAASRPVRLRFEEGPRQHAMATSQWRLRQLRGPGKMAIVAWRTVAATIGGGRPCPQVSPSDCGYSLPLHNINSRLIQYTFMPPLDVLRTQVAASQCCCCHVLSGEMPAEGTLAGGNDVGGFIFAARRKRLLVSAAGGGGMAMRPLYSAGL
jgi:hypothetical protein